MGEDLSEESWGAGDDSEYDGGKYVVAGSQVIVTYV